MAAMNQYAGYVVGSDTALDRVSPEIDPRKFFDEYIAKRKPCIITSHLHDAAWTAGKKWADFDYLRKYAGDALLSVEPRDSTKDTFGKGRKVSAWDRSPLRQLLRTDTCNTHTRTYALTRIPSHTIVYTVAQL